VHLIDDLKPFYTPKTAIPLFEGQQQLLLLPLLLQPVSFSLFATAPAANLAAAAIPAIPAIPANAANAAASAFCSGL
jgi:hypothetical protein